MKTTVRFALPLTLITLLIGCAATVPIKGMEVPRLVAQAWIKAPSEGSCAPIMSWWQDSNSINGNPRSSGVHNGLDMVATVGTSVVSAAPGVVVFKRFERGGHDVQIYHGVDKFGNQVFSAYAHMSKFSGQVGDFFARGQEIGKSGDQGLGTGREAAHLHFGAFIHSKHDYQVIIDPLRPSQWISPVPFVYPLTNGATAHESIPSFNPSIDYGDANWDSHKRFTGFTFPVKCG